MTLLRTSSDARYIGFAAAALALAIPLCSQENPNSTGSLNKKRSATLTWAAPAGAQQGVTRYHIYRADGSKHKGYIKCEKPNRIAEVTAPSTSYTDESVEPGRTYCYTVRSVVGNAESPPTDPVIVSIPSKK